MRPSDLDPARWRRIDDVFDAALDVPPEKRPAFLDEACGDDHDLRAQVEALLDAHRRSEADFDESPSPLTAVVESAVQLPQGTRVGPFRLIREVGRGGMGVVYEAEDTRLGRRVALKALPPYLGIGVAAKQRFMSEARAVSTLDHPNIATLFEIDATDSGQLYMAFAFYEGETLATRITRGPLPLDEAISITTGIAAGLAAAHSKGIIHRDVKPSNVLLPDGGGVKLLDFGVAKMTGGEPTEEGVRLGTIAYMAPEHASGGFVDARADLWSLGVVVYEMLSEERPFSGTDQQSLIRSIVDDEPVPLEARRSDLPATVPRFVGLLLAKRPEARYASADEVLQELQSLSTGISPVGPRTPPPAAAPSGDSSARGPTVRTGVTAPRRRYRSFRRGAAAALIAVVLTGVWLASTRANGTARSIDRIAVIPLANLTGEEDQEHIVQGIHGALIAELSRIGALDVMSRTSVMRYRDTQASLPEIAEQLGVDAIVEGSVSKLGDTLSITTQLIAAFPERNLWAGRYERGVGGVFEVAAEVASGIAVAIEIELSPEEEARLVSAEPVDPAAFDAYSLGQFNLGRRSPEGFELAQRYLQLAISIDPGFAPAYATLAEAYGSAAFFGQGRPADIMPVVRGLSETALGLDSTLAEAHRTMAAVALYWDWDWAAAERGVRRAITLNRSDPSSHELLSEILSVTGRYQESLDAIERGSQLQRFVPFSAFRPVVVLYYMREFEAAAERARVGLEFFTDFWQGHWLLCLSMVGQGDQAEAIASCEEAAERSRRTPMALGALGYAYAVGGQPEEATQVAQELETRAELSYVGASYVAMVHAGLGDRDRALRWLARAYSERDVQLVHLADYAFFDSLHDDPGFMELLQKVGLEP